MRILVDIDNTCIDSNLEIIRQYREYTNDYKIPYVEKDIGWDFSPVIDSNIWDGNKITKTFSSKEFYNNVKLKNDCNYVLNKLINLGHEVIIVTKPSKNGLDLRIDFINKNIPNTSVIFLMQDNFDKSIINGDIIIDDVLESHKGDRKLNLLFGNYGYNNDKQKKEWEKKNNKQLIRCKNWKEVLVQIEKIEDNIENSVDK